MYLKCILLSGYILSDSTYMGKGKITEQKTNPWLPGLGVGGGLDFPVVVVTKPDTEFVKIHRLSTKNDTVYYLQVNLENERKVKKNQGAIKKRFWV